MSCLQELVEIIGRSTGIALMAPPTDNDTAQKTLDTLLSAVNKKQKVACLPSPTTPPHLTPFQNYTSCVHILTHVPAVMYCILAHVKPGCKRCPHDLDLVFKVPSCCHQLCFYKHTSISIHSLKRGQTMPFACGMMLVNSQQSIFQAHIASWPIQQIFMQ